MARENSRLMRTINELAEFDFIIKYRPGSENNAADAMSRTVREPISTGLDKEMDCPILPD